VRVVGEITTEKLDQLKAATTVVEEAFKGEKPAQYFTAIMSGGSHEAPEGLREGIQAVLGRAQWNASVGYLSEKATGMLEGRRTYGSVAEVAVRDEAGKPVNLGYQALERVRGEIQSKNPEVSRVLYFIAGKGDEKGYCVAMRAVETRDFLTAKVSEIPWPTLESAANKILDTCKKVTKVSYDVTPKPPATVEFE
jgi:GMP synthase PP-ATPase subunit